MNKLELQKTAVEVRKGIVSAVHSAKAGHPARQKNLLHKCELDAEGIYKQIKAAL